MAYTSLGVKNWGSYTSPTIKFETFYDLKRNGTDMQYKIKVVLKALQSPYYFGYPIYLRILFDDVQKVSKKTIKNASPNTWSDNTYLYESDWITIENKTSGTTKLGIRLYSGSGNTWDATMNFTLPIIPAVSTFDTLNDFVVGDTIPLEFTKYDNTYVDTLTIKIGDNVVKTISNITSPASIEFTNTELNNIYSLMSAVNSTNFTFILSTVDSEETSLGTETQTVVGTITDANPIFTASNITYHDSNLDVVAVTQDNQKLVQSLSNLIVTIVAATAQKGASIVKYTAVISDITREILVAGNIDFGTFNTSTDLVLKVIAEDSRGNTTTVEKNVAFLEWILPTANISLTRLNNYEDTTYLTVKANYSSVDSKNQISIKYQKKKSEEDTYSELVEIQDNIQATTTCDKNYVWDFRIIVADSFGTTTYNGILAKGKFIVFYDVKKYSIGVNGFPTHDDSLEVFGDIYVIDANNHSTKIDGDSITLNGTKLTSTQLQALLALINGNS